MNQLKLKILIIIFARIFNFGCQSNPVQKIIESNKNSQDFKLYSMATEKQKTAVLTDENIVVNLLESKIKARKLDTQHGKESVLSIPIEIINVSSQQVNMELAPVAYGGEWLGTDLYTSAKETDKRMNMTWYFGPAYQVKNIKSGEVTTLQPSDKITADICLNWRGTGSIQTPPLIDESKTGKYTIRFLLFFRINDSEEYLETQEFDIEVEK